MSQLALSPRSSPLHLISQDLRGLQQVAGILTTIQYLGMLGRTIRPVLSSKSLMPADEAMPKKVYRLRPIKGRPEVLVDTLADGRLPTSSHLRESYTLDASTFANQGSLSVLKIRYWT